MKTIKHFLLITCLSTGIPILAAEPAPGVPTNEAPSAPATDHPDEHRSTAACANRGSGGRHQRGRHTRHAGPGSRTSPPTPSRLPTPSLAPTQSPPACRAAVVVENGTNGLRLNFHNAPLSLVLDYLSDAAGFVINKETDVRGTVDVQGKDLTKDEAVEVLNSALKKNGCAVIRNGRILTIVAQDTAKTKETSGRCRQQPRRGRERG